MAEWQKHRPSPLINRSLLVPKIFNLFYSASSVSLYPFFPVYFRLLGLTAFQSGLVGAGRCLISSWSTPLWCLSAEKTDKRKCLMLLMLLVGIALNMSLALVHKDDSRFGEYSCTSERWKNFAESNVTFNPGNGSQINHSNSSLFSNPSISLARGKVFTVVPGTGQRQVNTEGSKEILINLLRERNYSYDRDTLSSVTLDSTSRRRRKNFEASETSRKAPVAVFLNLSWSNFSSVSGKPSIKKDYWFRMIGFRIDPTFKVLLILVLVTEFLSSPVKSLSDSLTSDIVQWSKSKSMAVQRAWGSFGIMVGAGTIAVVIGYYGCSFGVENAFYLHFYIFAFFGSASLIFGMFFKSLDIKAPGQFYFGRTCSFLCCDIHILSFILILWAIGVSDSLHSNFMMWYLYDINASRMVMGLILIATGFSELSMHVVAPYLIRLTGQEWLMFLSLLSYGVRFLYFSYIKNQWLIIPIELLHGVSQTMMWHACASYAVVATPHGMERTMQTIFVMVYKFFGIFVGGVGVSLLYQLYGPIVVFRCAAGVCCIYSILYAMLQCILVLPDDAKERRRLKLLEYRQFPGRRGIRNGDPSHQVDWLLEALDADEEENIFSR